MLTLEEINNLMSDLNDWSLEGSMISKTFTLGNFREALEFVNKVGEIAEKLNHHPGIMMDYNIVRLNLTTHSEKGLTKKDFETAKEIDKI